MLLRSSESITVNSLNSFVERAISSILIQRIDVFGLCYMLVIGASHLD